MAECPAKIDLNVLPLEKANFAEPAMERCHVCRRVVWEPPAEEPDHRHRRLLRVRRERPRGRTAEERDELAPFHQQFLPCFQPEDTTAGNLLHCGISIRPMSESGHSLHIDETEASAQCPLHPQ